MGALLSSPSKIEDGNETCESDRWGALSAAIAEEEGKGISTYTPPEEDGCGRGCDDSFGGESTRERLRLRASASAGCGEDESDIVADMLVAMAEKVDVGKEGPSQEVLKARRIRTRRRIRVQRLSFLFWPVSNNGKSDFRVSADPCCSCSTVIYIRTLCSDLSHSFTFSDYTYDMLATLRLLNRQISTNGAPIKLLMYTGTDCQLCTVMQAEIAKASQTLPNIQLSTYNIRMIRYRKCILGERKYQYDIPVLHLDGQGELHNLSRRAQSAEGHAGKLKLTISFCVRQQRYSDTE